MPLYKVWYKNNEEPFEFNSASICSDEEIVSKVLEHEHMTAVDFPDRPRSGPEKPSLRDIIHSQQLGSVRYVVDESEMIAIA
ncbi:MAG: hypothetical protein V4724_18615 [Pseudomonadota bacterium]